MTFFVDSTTLAILEYGIWGNLKLVPHMVTHICLGGVVVPLMTHAPTYPGAPPSGQLLTDPGGSASLPLPPPSQPTCPPSPSQAQF